MDKAHKKSLEADRIGQLAAILEELVPLENHFRNNWLEDIEAAAQQIIDHESEAPKAMVDDAATLIFRCRALRQHERVGNTLATRHEAFQIGILFERLNSSDAAVIARLYNEECVLDKGRAIKVSQQERRILEFITGRTEASIGEFVPAIWSEPYTLAHRNKYDQAIHRLNSLMAKEGVPLLIGIDGTRLVIAHP